MTATDAARPHQGDGPPNHTGPSVPEPTDIIRRLTTEQLEWLSERLDAAVSDPELRAREKDEIRDAAVYVRHGLRRRQALARLHAAHQALRDVGWWTD